MPQTKTSTCRHIIFSFIQSRGSNLIKLTIIQEKRKHYYILSNTLSFSFCVQDSGANNLSSGQTTNAYLFWKKKRKKEKVIILIIMGFPTIMHSFESEQSNFLHVFTFIMLLLEAGWKNMFYEKSLLDNSITVQTNFERDMFHRNHASPLTSIPH